MQDHEYQRLIDETRSAVLALKCEIAAQRVLLAGRWLVSLLGKANFNPAQLRIPAGEPDGGRWTDGGGSGIILVGARGRTSVRVRVGSRTLEATPGQATRLAAADAWARDAISRVREIDPTWRPTPSLSGTVEGEIAARQGEAREAEARLRELARGGYGDNGGPPLEPIGPRAGTGTPAPAQCIASYRSIMGMPDIGERAARWSDGTVAYAEVDGRPVIGVNSDAPGYTMADEAAAQSMRAQLVERYPDIMATDNLGHMPNNALFHAEANALLRAEAGGRYLSGRTIEMRVDRQLCPSCDRVLPLVGLRVGNPTVRIIDGAGDLWIMRDGNWIRRGRR